MDKNMTIVNKIDVQNKKILIENAELEKLFNKINSNNGQMDITCGHEDFYTVLEGTKKSYTMNLRINENTRETIINQIVREFFLDIKLRNTEKGIWVHFKINHYAVLHKGKKYSEISDKIINPIMQSIFDVAHEDCDSIVTIEDNNVLDDGEAEVMMVVTYKDKMWEDARKSMHIFPH